MNCRPVDCVMLSRSPADRNGPSVRTHDVESPFRKFVKKLLLWKLANKTPDRVGWNPDADVPSPNGNSIFHTPGAAVPSVQIVLLSCRPPMSLVSGACGSSAT